ncbi:breast cancer type 2 susceptibility protein homolog isoform X2 [Drosophila gunungcola]|uniref:breast cancer type 2 susceptibility protein homolog isoform X2 n=1 Tax=Drosophila gunungcola TaxID=103775 RepID=UPI0022E91581|nr:breast cancer type 2 susceptibility protein homolog isoform X2 [Drosophila gunungcola]
MDLDSIPASPETREDNASISTQHIRNRETCKYGNPADKSGNQRFPADELASIYNADRQDSLHALRLQRQDRVVPATSEFVCLKDLLLAQSDPTPGEEIVQMILRDFCSSPTYVEEEDVPTCESPPWFRFRKKRIRCYSRRRVSQMEDFAAAVENEEEDRLSCSSDLSVQEDLNNASSTAAVCNLDANTSQKIHENLQNLSQYFSLSNTSPYPNNAQTPAVQSRIDLPPKSRRDSEKPSYSREHSNNFSDKNSSAECTHTELINLKNDLLEIGFTFEASQNCDIKPQGLLADTLFGDSRTTTTFMHSQLDIKLCDDWSDADSFMEQYNTEKMSLDGEDSKPKTTLTNQIKTETVDVKEENADTLILDDIPISEWQTPMDIPEESIHETKKPTQEIVKLEPSEVISQKIPKDTVQKSTSQDADDTQFLKGIQLDDWQPLEIPEFIGFRTASNKQIEVSKEMQDRAAKLLADFKEDETHQQKYEPDSVEPKVSEEFVGFRTASNKPIEITEEMESKGAMFIAQFKTTEQPSQSNDDVILQGIAFSEWQPMVIPDDVPTTSKKLTAVPEQIKTQQSYHRNEAELPEGKTPTKKLSMNIPQLVGFRKTAYKFLEVSEEMKTKGNKLIDEVESGLYQPSQKRKSRTQEHSENLSQCASETEFVGFRTASNKPIEISDEMKKKAAKLIAEVEAGEMNQEISSASHETINEPIFEGFRTASNKQIVVSEEMKNKALQLMAEFKSEDSNLQNNCIVNPIVDPACVGFCTAANKPIVVSEEMKTKAAKFMAEVQAEEISKEMPSRDCHTDKNLTRQTEYTSECFGFRTASNKRIEISEEMRVRAAKLMADVAVVMPPEIPRCKPTNVAGKPKEGDSDSTDSASGEEFHGFPIDDDLPFPMEDDLFNDSVFPRLSQRTQNMSNSADNPSVVTPKHRRDTSDGIPSSKRRRSERNSPAQQNRPQCSRQLQKTTSCHSALTPQDIHASLSQALLDKSSTTSVIARRNLSLSKRSKRISTPTGTSAESAATPVKPRFAPMPTFTSTPLADRNVNLAKESTNIRQNAEDMSPICMPPNKSRRLGLSRSRY